MKFIGITGGVGAGKSVILSYIENNYNAKVLLADRVAEALMSPGTKCYERLELIFANDAVFLEDGTIDRPAMAQVIFADDRKRQLMNEIVHPAVKEHVLTEVALARAKGEIDYFFFEAALLIEDHYDLVCDELWYIYTSQENRRQRLKEHRGYSDEKIDGIFASQLSEETFRLYCKQVIDNNGSKKEAFEQIDALLAAVGSAPIKP